MKLRFDYNNMMRKSLGSRGIPETAFADEAGRISAAFGTVMGQPRQGLAGVVRSALFAGTVS